MPPGGTLLLNPIVNWPLLAPPPATVWVPGVTVNTVGAAAAAVGANITAGNIPATRATAAPTAIRPNVRLLMGVPSGQGLVRGPADGCGKCADAANAAIRTIDRPDRILARCGLRLPASAARESGFRIGYARTRSSSIGDHFRADSGTDEASATPTGPSA